MNLKQQLTNFASKLMITNKIKKMKVIFVVQGEGRGHLTQALALEKALEEKGHNYEIGDTIETEEVAFVPMTKEIDDETAYNAFGTITSKSGNNYVIVVKSEKELTQDNLETVAEAVKEQVK